MGWTIHHHEKVLTSGIINSKPELIHAVNMKHDPVINELKPYLSETPNTKFRDRAHQQDIMEERDEVKSEDIPS